MQRFLYVFCYDICDDRRRRAVAEALETVGVRVQESVFECWLEPRTADQVGRALQKQLHAGDLLNWYRLGRDEAHEVRVLGLGSSPAEPHGWYA